tara:strand:+ start:13960 stop:14121 length:162 start_codon:yes stop_codon:yes gene_type:complete
MSHTTDRAKKIAKELEASPALAATVGNLLGKQTKARIVEGLEPTLKDTLGDLF